MKNEKTAIELSISELINENIQQVLLDVLPCVAVIIKTGTQEVVASNFAAKAAGASVGAKCDEKSFWFFDSGKCDENSEFHEEMNMDGKLWSAHWVPLYNDLYLLYAVDITEYKNTEYVLKDSLRNMESYHRAFLQMPESSMIISPDGIVIDVNESAAMQLGYLKPELVGQPLARIYDMETLLFSESGEEMMQPGTCIKDEEVVLKTKENKRKTVLMSISPVYSENGCLSHSILFFTDVTDAKKKDDVNQRNVRNELLGHVASGVSYDFNNFLRAITGFIDLAAAGTDDKRVEKYLVKALHTVEKAKSLIRDMLTLSRDGTPQKNIMPLFPSIREQVDFMLKGSGVRCQSEVEEGLWACEYDSAQINKVIMNMITNALEAMPDGGTLTISALNKEFGENEHGSLHAGKFIEIAIRDTGVGIPCQMIPHIFDPFYTTKPNGRGLGLTTCYSIIQRHGGCIDVYSYPEHGSIFTLYLPAVLQSDCGSAITSYLSRCYSKKPHIREMCS